MSSEAGVVDVAAMSAGQEVDCEQRCEFGLCSTPADHMVMVPGEDGGFDDLVVCGMHVRPAVTWGRTVRLNSALVRRV